MVASPAVNASRSGPGYLVSWPSRGDAVAYAVFKARYPSPSFYELDEKCCPLLPSLTLPLVRPCCPVRSGATTLQVEGGVDAGVQYKFRVVAMLNSGANETIGRSTWERAATVPGAPGIPSLALTSPTSGAIFDVSWAPPASDGGDLIRGYRIWANVTSLNASRLVLVANTSSGRPLHLRDAAAQPLYRHLPLWPTHRYELFVQGLNTVGGGALSPPLAIEAPVGPRAEFEIPLFAWRRATVGRGAITRHRIFIPTSVSRARIVVQQTHSGYLSSSAASLAQRQRAFHTTALQLYVRAGSEPPTWPSPILGQRGPFSPYYGREELEQFGKARDELADDGRFNGSASGGELSIELTYPTSRWLHIVVHAAAVEEADAEYDIRAEATRGAVAATGHAGDDVTGLERFEVLDERWRYRVDPDGPSSLSAWTLARHVHPLSSDPTLTPLQTEARLAAASS